MTHDKNDQAHVDTKADAESSRTAAVADASAHTPGPWEWRGDDYDLVNPEMYRRWVDGGYKESDWPFVLQGEWHNDSSAGISVHGEANARLIAAAPELLAALKDTIAHSDALQAAGRLREPELQPLYDAAVAAVAKAEGR